MSLGESVRPFTVSSAVMGSEWEEELRCGLCAPLNEEVGEEVIDETVEPTDGNDGEDFGQERPKTLPTPYTPSKQERIEHELTHVPYRSWCPHCVRGKATSMDIIRRNQKGLKIVGFR